MMKITKEKEDNLSFGQLSFIKNNNYGNIRRGILDEEESVHSRINISEFKDAIFETKFTPVNSNLRTPCNILGARNCHSFNRNEMKGDRGRCLDALTQNFDEKIDGYLRSFGKREQPFTQGIKAFDAIDEDSDENNDENISNFSEEFEISTNPDKKLAVSSKPGCNCTKSGCIKKYCQCFARGVKCSKSCNCINCLNTPTEAHYRKPRTKKVKKPRKYDVSCNCKNSRCIKFYCRCFRKGLDCTKNCKCLDCLNNPTARNKRGDKDGDGLLLGKRSKAEYAEDLLESDSVLSGFEELVKEKRPEMVIRREVFCGVKKIKMNLLNHFNLKVKGVGSNRGRYRKVV